MFYSVKIKTRGASSPTFIPCGNLGGIIHMYLIIYRLTVIIIIITILKYCISIKYSIVLPCLFDVDIKTIIIFWLSSNDRYN